MNAIPNPEEILGTTENLLKNSGLDEYEIYLVESAATVVEAKDQAVDAFHVSQEWGLSVRGVKGHRPGFAFGNSGKKADLRALVSNLVSGTAATFPDPDHGFPEPSSTGFSNLEIDDPEMERVSDTERIARALTLEQAAHAYDPRILRTRKAEARDVASRVFLRNSRGLEASFRKTLCSARILAVAGDGVDSQTGYGYAFAPFFAQLDPERVGKEAAQKAVEMLGARALDSRRGAAVLDSFAAVSFLEIFSPAFLSDSVQKHKSRLENREGEKVVSSQIDIYDNGLMPGGMGSSPVDGEGVPRQTTALVTEGVLNGFLYDTYWAKKAGRVSSGNSTRSGIKIPPFVGISNFYIAPGPISGEALLKAAGPGVLITDVMGVHMANPISGDFSVGVTGFVIENGTKGRPFRGMVLSGNVLELFQQVEMVADDLRFWGQVGSPSLLITGIHLSGK